MYEAARACRSIGFEPNKERQKERPPKQWMDSLAFSLSHSLSLSLSLSIYIYEERWN